jgi:plastocyanin
MYTFRFITLCLALTLLLGCSLYKPYSTEPHAKPVKNTAENQATKPSQTANNKVIPTPKETKKPIAPTVLKASNAKTPQATSVKPSPNSKPPIRTVAPTPKQALGALRGKITLTDSSGNILSSEGAMISLKRSDKTLKDNPNSQAKSYTVNTRDKTYLPGFITVNVDDTIIFKNNDAIKHNVFSSSGVNTFDLGTYGYNREERYTVKHEGIIKVYCNIHPEMALFVSSSKNNLSFITDKSGEYLFKNIKPGNYTLSVWHLRGNTEKQIKVIDGKVHTENLTIDSSSYTPKPHTNKHGKAYKKQPAIFKDEFY